MELAGFAIKLEMGSYHLMDVAREVNELADNPQDKKSFVKHKP